VELTNLFYCSGLRRAVEVIADEMSQLGYSFTFELWKKIFEQRQDILSKKEIEIKIVKSKSSDPPSVPIYLYFLDQLIDTTNADSNGRLLRDSTETPKSTPLHSKTKNVK
jgi:hypothetical protein